jgi:paraquat-inducible protein B
MSQKANPASIGLFVVIGLALVLTGLILFSSSRLFTSSRDFVLYFNSTLNGLTEGAPVKYRGVTIGSVKRVMIRFNQASNDFSMPVIIQVQEDLVSKRLGDPSLTSGEEKIELGLRNTAMRGTLLAESLVTGVLYVNLDIETNAPPAVYHQLKAALPEIPTRPSETQTLLRNLAKVDFDGLEGKLSRLLVQMDETIAALRTGDISSGITNLLSGIHRVVAAPELTNAVATFGGAMGEIRLLAENVNRRVDPLADSATNALTQASLTLAQLRDGAENLRVLLAPDSALRYDLNLALEQLADAAQSISALAQFLQTHPNALITGRQQPARKP